MHTAKTQFSLPTMLTVVTGLAAFYGGQPLLSTPSRSRACVASQNEPLKTAQGVDVNVAAADISRLLREDAAAAAETFVVDKEVVSSEMLEAALEATVKAAEETGVDTAADVTALRAAKAKQLRVEQEETRALEAAQLASAKAEEMRSKMLEEDATKLGLKLGSLGLSAGLALGDVALSLSIGAGKALAQKAAEALEPEPEPEPVDILKVLDLDHAEHDEQVGLVKGYMQQIGAGMHNFALLKVEEGKARVETEALNLKHEIAAMPEKAATGARDKVVEMRHEATDAIVNLPGKATLGAKEALFSQQQTARSKVRLARMKKRQVAAEVNANNARLAEVARVVVPGLKPTPPPAPAPKKFLGLF